MKLENHNYLLWKSQFLLVLRANELPEFVDGTFSCPPEFAVYLNGNASKDVNPNFYTQMTMELVASGTT